MIVWGNTIIPRLMMIFIFEKRKKEDTVKWQLDAEAQQVNEEEQRQRKHPLSEPTKLPSSTGTEPLVGPNNRPRVISSLRQHFATVSVKSHANISSPLPKTK